MTRSGTPTPALGMPEAGSDEQHEQHEFLKTDQAATVGPSPATHFAAALLCGFVAAGVREFVVCPGSRSQALALAASELERLGAARMHVRVDERSAAFLALGLAVETGMPAVVVTTSGTAPANLLPAVLEAHHSGVPIILVTADRPQELRGTGANQTTWQAGLYGYAARRSLDIAAPTGEPGEAEGANLLASDVVTAALGAGERGAGGRGAGPVHVNLAFREPLSGPLPKLDEYLGSRIRDTAEPESSAGRVAPGGSGMRRDRRPEPADASPTSSPVPSPYLLVPGPRTVVVAGHGAGEAAERLAVTAGWPLLAEVSSGARFGPNLVVRYRELLAAPEFGGRVERAVVFGHPTISREIPGLLNRDDVEVVVVAPSGAEPFNPGHRAELVGDVILDPDSSYSTPDWRGTWVHGSRRLLEASNGEGADRRAPDVDGARSHAPAERLAFVRAELDAVRAPVTRRMLVEAVWRFTWPHDRLVLGASRLIREADAVVPGRRIRVHANRGLSGIDGTVATATGIALASQSPVGEADAGRLLGVTRVLLGDLTLLHDVGSLLFGRGEGRPHLQVIVGNDGGGTVFDSLEVADTAHPDAFDRVMYTPHDVDVAALAAAYSWEYARATTRGELDQALSSPPVGASILEVPLSRP